MNPNAAANLTNAGKGRPLGAVNKTTASVKAALTEAFEKRGGVPALLEWADKEPTAFYQLWSKLLPAEVDITSNGATIAAIAAASYARLTIIKTEPMEEIQAPVQHQIEAKTG